MTYLQLEDIKKHLNIDSDFTDDDNYITSLGDVAEQAISTHIESDLSVIAQDNGGVLPSPLLHAMLLLCGTLYMSRETVSFGSATQVPLSVNASAYDYLLSPYISYKNSAR